MMMANNRRPIPITLFIVCCICLGCKNAAPKKITQAFYYWKTNVALTAFERKKLDSLACKTLYVRFFDVAWDAAANEPRPIAVTRFIQPLPPGFACVPVIFITQEALNNIHTNRLQDLAAHAANLLYEKCVQAKISPAEIQIDFDWATNNKDKYFHLLALFKKQAFFKGKTLSCTIRLHQVGAPALKGIPPVDRGLLMCYNMGSLRLPGNNNSILDAGIAERYLQNMQDYPLPLDVALPLFSWYLLYDTENRFTGILRDVQESDVKNTTLFTLRAKNLYTINKDTLWKGYNLRKTETIRYEYCDTVALYKLANFVAGKMNGRQFSLIFYHCDSAVLSKYNQYELEKIYHFFN